jgi:predicted alpha/beta-hydrolase family hydrolase
VQSLVDAPDGQAPRFVVVLAHGAGAGMTHSFLASFAALLVERGVAVFRYNFPYMESGSKRPDGPAVAHAAVRAACAEASARFPGVPLVAGGKSFGGRMTSQAQAAGAIANVAGVAFVGFPLHPPDKPGVERAAHLADVSVPMLFLQGTRDELAQLPLLEPVVAGLGARATLRLWDDADHSFHVPAKTGRKDAEVRAEALRTMAQWIGGII